MLWSRTTKRARKSTRQVSQRSKRAAYSTKPSRWSIRRRGFGPRVSKSGQQPCRALHNPAAPNSEFRPLSRDKDAVQGTNPSYAALDEVHVYNGRGVYDDIRNGMTARVQPLIGCDYHRAALGRA
jgi:hypothetical protein